MFPKRAPATRATGRQAAGKRSSESSSFNLQEQVFARIKWLRARITNEIYDGKVSSPPVNRPHFYRHLENMVTPTHQDRPRGLGGSTVTWDH
jgi:hypothetical protein